MKKLLSYLIVFITIYCINLTSTYAVEQVDTSLKIYDYGEFLSIEEETYLKQLIDNYIEKYNMDLVIVTKKDYYGNMKSYAQDFYDYNYFGCNKTYDGILLFLNVDKDGPIVEIVTTGEAIRMYDDERINELMLSMKSAKQNGNEAIIEIFILRADKYASRGIPESNKDTYIDENGEYRRIYKRTYPAIIIFLISGISTLIIVYLMSIKNNNIKKLVDAHQYLDTTTFKLVKNTTKFVSTHTSKTYIDTNHSSGGSHRGGSSVSHGSSGRSHGGGGGRL